MKEITRRLYTKPVMLGMAFLAGMALLVGSFVTAKSRAAVAFTVIEAGDDKFETTGNGETYHDFGGAPIPAGFFTSNGGSPSLAYNQPVPLVGKPLSTGSDIDTIIHRNDNVTVPGTTSLTMTGLSLESISPITITYADGTTEKWRVNVGLSAFRSSTGSMTINSGGTFDSSLKVWPKFTFTSELDSDVEELDTGSGSSLMASSLSSDTGEIEPTPAPAPQPAPCKAVANDFETVAMAQNEAVVSDATATSSCPPVTLTSSNSPWQICADGKFCIPRPITEAEILASHNASPPGTKKQLATKTAAIR
jgi:hypothetical protein